MEKSKRYYVNLNESFTDIKYRLTDIKPHSIGYHHHDGLEIIQIWSDSGTVLVGDNIYPIKKGSIYLIDSSTAHCTNPDINNFYIRSKITFSQSALIPLLETTDSMHLLNLFTNKNSGSMVELDTETANKFDKSFKLIYEEFDNKNSDYHPLMVSVLLAMLTIINRINSTNTTIENNSTINPIILSIIEYINQNILNEINIDDICNHLHFSKYYLCHTFKKHTGVTITQYIIERKISNAKILLTNTKKPVSVVALESGFNGLTQFSRTFSRTTGMSPLKYRKLKSSN